MDKTNRALIGVEDNAEAIRALKVRLDVAESALDKVKMSCEIGQYKVVSGKSNTSFGAYGIYGPTVFVVAPGDSVNHELYFADVKVMSGVGTLIFKADSGEGELRLYPNAASPRALIIGEATKTE